MSSKAFQRSLLFTPGPLTTRQSVRDAMNQDLGSREAAFTALTTEVRRGVMAVVDAPDDMTAVPIQGSGTFGVEAMLGTLVRPGERLLIACNGSYGERMATIAARLRIDATVMRWAWTEPVDPAGIADALDRDASIAYVAVVHGETTTGIINPLEEIARVTRSRKRHFLVDAMSTFGGWPLSLRDVQVSALAASSNKCLEGVPGVAFVIVEQALLAERLGNSPSLSLDLAEQWRALEANGQWRFTPPTHVIAALAQALRDLTDEGGPRKRHARYEALRLRLVSGMRALGFETLLPDLLQGPVIVTFKERPDLPFADIYRDLEAQGFILYPGKLTEEPTFRIGCIGNLGASGLDAMLAALNAHVMRGTAALDPP